MTPSDVADIQLLWPHTILIDKPFLDEENETTGILTPYSEQLPKVFTRVLKAHKCDYVQEGDTIMFLPHHVLDYLLSDGRRLYAMDERAATTILPFSMES